MKEFTPPAPIAEFLDEHRTATLNVRFGGIAAGPIAVETPSKGKYRARRQPIPLTHPLFAGAAEASPSLVPSLVIEIADSRLSGSIGMAAGRNVEALAGHLRRAPELLGFFGITFPSLPMITNTLEAGSLRLGLNGIPFRLGSAFGGSLTLVMVDESITFDGNAAVVVQGLARGNLGLRRGADGLIAGKVTLALTLPKNFSGGFEVEWDGRAAKGEGRVGYAGEKLSGQVVLRMMEKGEAASLERQRKAPEGSPPPPQVAPSRATPARVDYVVFGEGELNFAFTEWLNGTARVIVDPRGFVTIIGKITPQKEFILFEQKDYVRQLFKVEARASYGLPVVGNIFIFANVGMDVFAKLGPAKFYNIVVDGTYSTDPQKAMDFSIRGSLNLSAGAGARLRAEAGAGLEILDHDIKAGAGVNGIAGIKAYAEATPIIGYREAAAPGQDKKGEFFIRGDLEVAAQPFLGLSGDLFVEVDSPWWSPLPDKKWTWPLFGKEWPLGGSMGLLASVDYVFGSGQWPRFDLKPAEFSSEKFMTNLYEDKAGSGTGKEVEKPGKWQEKNGAAATPPPKASPRGSLAPGKPSPATPARSRPRAGKRGGRPADPNARTREGKTVRQLQDEASRKGKKAQGEDLRKGAGPGGAATKDSGRRDHDEKLKEGIAALDAVTARYARDGATREEVIGGVKAVRRKFKIFKSIEVIDGGETWDYAYVATKGTRTGARKAKGSRAAAAQDPSSLKVGTVIQIHRPITSSGQTSVWSVATVTEVDFDKGWIRYRTANLGEVNTGTLRFESYNTSWRLGHISQVKLAADRLAEENKKEQWDEIDIARKVLNYRHHGAETNVAGTQWEHIIERSAGGVHSSTNLALTDSTINNRLGKWFERPYSRDEAPPGLPGTDGKDLRDYLKGRDRAVHLAWKIHAYNLLGLRLVPRRSERGRWMELVPR